jgi:lipopolysaccharide export LptBFGC system permease protein LptF
VDEFHDFLVVPVWLVLLVEMLVQPFVSTVVVFIFYMLAFSLRGPRQASVTGEAIGAVVCSVVADVKNSYGQPP